MCHGFILETGSWDSWLLFWLSCAQQLGQVLPGVLHGAQPCVVLQELCEAAPSQRLELLWLTAGVLGSA